ncbi:UDP-glucosyltransferase 2-like [Manduca sexta]|uniref:UDP-glucosyltransferase 2-like n=1 Tax=Manduca sexta TaxID=7130 RepID=UPI00188FC760|nr:UDP-glucosyltransferase 2-like [Manduca sexta]
MNTRVNFARYLLITCVIMTGVQTLNILGVFPYEGKSHFFVFHSYLQELARRGHNVTVISHFPQKNPSPNYHDISLAGTSRVFEDMIPFERSYFVILKIGFFIVDIGTENCRKLLGHPEVQQLWKTKAKFDVVVVEQFNSDCGLGLAHQLGAPVVGINSHVLMPFHYSRFGIPYNPSFVPFQFFNGGTKPTLYERIESNIFHAYFNIIFKYWSQNVNQRTLAQYFDDVPPLDELAKDIKIMLLYHNFILYGSTILSSNVKEVGGYHVAAPKELPADIKKFIEESEHGVIYISFGSMLKASTTPRDKVEAIISAVSELPQRVIWKWDEKTLPGIPKNILVSKWLPQNDILAHPKVLAFFSHCGLLGTTEAIYHGVPVVGMPVFGDQPGNAAAIEESGLGVRILIEDLTKENLLEKIKTVLDPNFRNKVKQLSKAWHDRPMSAMDSAIYWTEFAAKYRNLTFRSPSADVPLYQYMYIDVILVLGSILITMFFVARTLLKLILYLTRLLSKDNKNKLKSN